MFNNAKIGLIHLPLYFAGVSLHAGISRTEVGEHSPVITIEVNPPSGVSAYAVEDAISAGALPSLISDKGVYDVTTRKVKWGPFTDDQPRSLTYRLSGLEGPVNLSASVSFGGSAETLVMTSVDLPDPERTFFGWLSRRMSEREFSQIAFDPQASGTDGLSLFDDYAFLLSSASLKTRQRVSINRLESVNPTAEVQVLVNAAALDVSFSAEASDDLVGWEPIESLFQSVSQTRQSFQDRPEFDRITVGPIPLDTYPGLFFRVNGSPQFAVTP